MAIFQSAPIGLPQVHVEDGGDEIISLLGIQRAQRVELAMAEPDMVTAPPDKSPANMPIIKM